jgi:hypothetical protein
MSLHFDHFCALNKTSVCTRYHRRTLYQPLKQNRIGLLFIHNHSLPAVPQIVKLWRLYSLVKWRTVIDFWLGSLNPTIRFWKPYIQQTTSPITRERSISLSSLPTINLPPELYTSTPRFNMRVMLSIHRIQPRSRR